MPTCAEYFIFKPEIINFFISLDFWNKFQQKQHHIFFYYYNLFYECEFSCHMEVDKICIF